MSGAGAGPRRGRGCGAARARARRGSPTGGSSAARRGACGALAARGPTTAPPAPAPLPRLAALCHTNTPRASLTTHPFTHTPDTPLFAKVGL
ncbi:unnamed protein product, partial [Iphiclides podalirius]